MRGENVHQGLAAADAVHAVGFAGGYGVPADNRLQGGAVVVVGSGGFGAQLEGEPAHPVSQVSVFVHSIVEALVATARVLPIVRERLLHVGAMTA